MTHWQIGIRLKTHTHWHPTHTQTPTYSHTRSSPQRTPPAMPEWPWLLCWSSRATADIALRSLFILSVLGPARFTYSPLHSLAANRLWTSRLSIMEGSLTVLWQARWIDSSGLLFIFACLANSLLGWVWSLACLNSRSNQLPPPLPQPIQPISVTVPNNWHWQNKRVARFPLLFS